MGIPHLIFFFQSVNNLGKTFELVGGVSACSLAFIFPPLLMWKGIGLKNMHPFRKFMTIFTLVCGFLIMFGSTLDLFDSYFFGMWHDIKRHS